MERLKQRACIDFLITQNCNYRCEYCSQSKSFMGGNFESASDETVDAFLKFLKTIDKNFEITISGGEPLTHPRFFEVVQAIADNHLKLSVISNFSFPIENYKKIADIMGDNFVELFVSYHSTQLKSCDDFLNKAQIFNSYKSQNTKFSIASVLSDENVEVLKAMSLKTKDLGIEFNLQHMRIDNKYVKYSIEAADFIGSHAIKEPGETISPFGKMCYAGCKFLLIYQNGMAYRCYSSRFIKKHTLGNIRDKNFKMWDGPYPCLNSKCTCPKPIAYNMLDLSKSNYLSAVCSNLYNFLCLPYLVCKNFGIITAKLRQSGKIGLNKREIS